MEFKLDTGAEVTAISEEVYQMLPRVKLLKASKVLYGPTQQRLKVLGQFTAQLSVEERKSNQAVFVVRGLQRNLLGLPAIQALQLISRVETLETQETDIPKKFPKLFEGLGNLGDPYKIQLKEDTKPHAIYAPRNIPIPLRSKVKQELKRMERAGVISKVSEPTQWCAGMIVVPKNSGSL